jgi:hypothetical protein
VHSWVRAKNGEGPQTGPNLWSLYNVLTAWSSHGETGAAGGQGQVRYDREVKVAKIIEGEVWRDLTGGAPAPRRAARQARELVAA